MSKPTKEEANYRYPEQCCGLCKHAYRNDYGTVMCLVLTAGSEVDLGGVCNLFELEIENV